MEVFLGASICGYLGHRFCRHLHAAAYAEVAGSRQGQELPKAVVACESRSTGEARSRRAGGNGVSLWLEGFSVQSLFKKLS